MKTYLCPLCNTKSAYVNEYGLPDSVICKCKGLNEVGRVKEGVYTPHNTLKNAEKNAIFGTNSLFVAGDFAFVKLKTDKEAEEMGIKFQNALTVSSQRTKYMSEGDIWVALNQKNDEKSIIFFIDNNRILKNFYLKKNMTPPKEDTELIKNALRQKRLIHN